VQQPSPQDFERIAEAYELLVNEEKRWAKERNALSEWLINAGTGQRRVLDLGTGTGFHARHLAGMLKARVIAADPSPAMLKVGRQKTFGDQVQWVEGLAQQPPDGEFDLALLLGNTLSLIQEPAPVFEAVAGVVVGGGLFVVQILDYEKLHEAGPQVREVRDDDRGIAIRKCLTPQPVGDALGAELELTVNVENGPQVCERHKLWDHSFQQIERWANCSGWELIEQRSSYDDHPGSDRIAVLRRVTG